MLQHGSTDPVSCMFHIFYKILDYVCFNNFLVSLQILHPFLSSVFSFRCKIGAIIMGGSTGHTLRFNKPRSRGHLNRAVRLRLDPSSSDNKSDIPCFKIYVYVL